MKTANNAVTAKKADFVKDDNFVNLDLASKAMINFKQLIASGKNATILNDVANSFVNKKDSATVKALTKDGIIKDLQQKVFQCQTLTNARKITGNDNFFDYAKFVKQVLSKKAPLSENQKGQVKTIVATAQCLRQGKLSLYAHGQISWEQLQGHYNITEQVIESVTEAEAQAPTESQTEAEAQASTVNMQDFKAIIDQLNPSDAALALELITARIEALAQMQQADESKAA